MKRRIIASLIGLFCVSVFAFGVFGEEIRAVLSPRVTYCDVLYANEGYVVPEGAVCADRSGMNYVMLIRKSEKFPERGYEALRYDCRVVRTDGGMAFVEFIDRISWNEKAVLTSDRAVYDGNKITLEG